MKTVKSIDDLRQLALRRGATMEDGLGSFNTERLRASAAAPKHSATVIAPPGPTATEVQAMMAKQEEVWSGMFAKLCDAFEAAVVCSMQPAPAAPSAPAVPAAPAKPVPWKFTATYDQRGLINEITATPGK